MTLGENQVAVSVPALLPLLAAGCFGLVSGFNDGGNLMGSFTSGRVISPRLATLLMLPALAGPLLLGTAVANTVGANVIDLRGQGSLGVALITLAPLSVVLLSWRLGIPARAPPAADRRDPGFCVWRQRHGEGGRAARGGPGFLRL